MTYLFDVARDKRRCSSASDKLEGTRESLPKSDSKWIHDFLLRQEKKKHLTQYWDIFFILQSSKVSWMPYFFRYCDFWNSWKLFADCLLIRLMFFTFALRKINESLELSWKKDEWIQNFVLWYKKKSNSTVIFAGNLSIFSPNAH